MFNVTEAWRAAYPGACVGVLALRGVENPAACPALEARKTELEQALRAAFAGSSRAALKAQAPFPAYQAYYGRFDKTYHVQLQLESVALKGKPLPRVAALVEAMFMAELEHRLLTAGHDRAALQEPLTLDVARGDERYTLLNGQAQVLKAGDMYIADRQGVISSILYGPDQRTRLVPETRAALFTVYAPAGIGAEAVRRHLETLRAYAQLIAPQAETEGLEVFVA